MTVELLPIDSKVLGRSVLSLQDLDPAADFAAFEDDYIRRYNPVYISGRIPLADIDRIHALEAAGFRLVECTIRSVIRLRKPFDVSGFPYRFEKVASEADLEPVLQIAASSFTHDRFSIDPLFGPEVAGERYCGYVRKSFDQPDEAVFRLVENASGNVVAFKTHRYLGNGEVLFLLGAVHPDYKSLGVGVINEYFEFNELIARGIKRATTHISAANHPIFNLEIGSLGFRVNETFAVMRKVYAGGEASQNPERTARRGVVRVAEKNR